MGLFKRHLQTSGLCRLDNCNNSERSSRRIIKTTSSPSEDATYQMFDKRTIATTLGHQEINSAHFWISVLTECLSCYIYVFIVCSTRISWTGSVIGHEPNLLGMAFSSGIAMMLLILTFRTVHVNPALTIAFLLTGRIPIIRALLYVLAHCMGSLAAVTSLYSISVKGHAGALGLDNPHDRLDSWQILIVEMVISFVVTLATYATCNYSCYTSARRFVLEQAVTRNGGLMFQDLFPASSTCDNIAVITNDGLQSNAPQLSRPINTTTAPLSRNARSSNGNFRVHPQSAKPSNGGFLSEIYANEEINSDYDYEYENDRMYANSHPQQHSSSNSDSPPMGASKVPPIEELMQNEAQLLAANGFSLRVTVGQALVIGLAYTLTSLSGIPASGASLNPARSFGPAFIMNRWDRHWIYWLGPIAGAIIAGFLFEFIFSPTRRSSLCYVPKLFRLSAHDMAKVCSKSRLFHHQQQQQQQQQNQKVSPFTTSIAAPNLYPTAPGVIRPNLHQQMLSTIQHSPNSRFANGTPSNFTTGNATMMNHQHTVVPASASLAQLQTTHHFNTSNHLGCDNMNCMQQRQQQALRETNFDRSKSTAIINLIAAKQQQGGMNLVPQVDSKANFHSASSSNGSSSHASSSNQAHRQQEFGKFSSAAMFSKDYQPEPTQRTMNPQSHSLFVDASKASFSEL